MISAFILGLLSSLHCLGMCGAIAIMLPVGNSNTMQKIIKIMLYHFGRVLVYTFLGLLFGILGKGLFIAGFQQNFSVILGILVIIYVFFPKKNFVEISFLKPFYNLINRFKKQIGIQFKKTSYFSLFFIGVMNGFLPCTMIYVALFSATATQQPILGAEYMAFYGLGTIPLMTVVVYISNFISVSVRNKIIKFIPVFVVVLGILLIIRGLGLDIPFLSPSTLNLFIVSNPQCA